MVLLWEGCWVRGMVLMEFPEVKGGIAFDEFVKITVELTIE